VTASNKLEMTCDGAAEMRRRRRDGAVDDFDALHPARGILGERSTSIPLAGFKRAYF